MSQGHKEDKLSPGVATAKLNEAVSCITGGGGHSIVITGEVSDLSDVMGVIVLTSCVCVCVCVSVTTLAGKQTNS